MSVLETEGFAELGSCSSDKLVRMSSASVPRNSSATLSWAAPDVSANSADVPGVTFPDVPDEVVADTDIARDCNA